MLYLACIGLGYLLAKGPDRLWLWFSETPKDRARRLVNEGRR